MLQLPGGLLFKVCTAAAQPWLGVATGELKHGRPVVQKFYGWNDQDYKAAVRLDGWSGVDYKAAASLWPGLIAADAWLLPMETPTLLYRIVIMTIAVFIYTLRESTMFPMTGHVRAASSLLTPKWLGMGLQIWTPDKFTWLQKCHLERH